MTENKVSKIVEELSKFTVLEMNELTKALEKHWGITSMQMSAVPSPSAQIDSESTAKPDVKKNFDLSLEKVGPKKIEVIKKVKELYGLGLKEAKDKVDSAPVILKNNLDQATAQDHKEKLEKSGATVQLQ